MKKYLIGLVVVAMMVCGAGIAQAAKGIPYGQQTVSQQRATDQQAAIKNGTSVTSNATTFAVAYDSTAAPQTTGYYNVKNDVSVGVPLLSGYYQWPPGSNNFYAVGPVTVNEEKSGQSDTPPPPACTASAPATPTLSTPSDGASLSSTSVSLLWNTVSSWGTACSGASNQYKLYVGTTNPPALYTTVSSSTLSTNYTGVKGTTYYWYVQASNGQLTANSATRTFTILNDQIAGKVFYDSANNCGGSGWSTGGVSVSVDGGAGTGVAGDGSYSVTASVLSPHTVEVGVPVGYACSTAAGCNSCSRSGIASPSANNNFYLTDLLEPWWQAAGAGVYAGGLGGGVTVRSQLPTASTSLILPGTTGSVAALLRASGSVGIGSGSVSDEGYSTMARYRGKKMDYNFFAAQMGVVRGQDSEFISDNLTLPSYQQDRDFWYSAPVSGTATVGDPWTVAVGEKYVIFVNGDLRIANDIQVANGGFLAFIVAGDVIIEPAVTSLQGIYVASSNFVTESQYELGLTNDVQLKTQGSIVAWGTISLGRNLGIGNSSIPAEEFGYRQDLLTNMPQKMKTYAMQWQEVVAGTFEN